MTEVLVIGAAGKTGRAVTRALLARGVTVRAAVRPGSSSAVYAGVPGPGTDAAPEVHTVPVDLESGAGLPVAMAGVSGVYHLAPNVHPDEVGIARRVAEAAVAEGVSRFAFHSVLHPDDASMPHHLRKAEAEREIRSFVRTATVLRPAAYHQNLVDAALAGRMVVPYSLDSAFTNVDLDDVAEVAALVLCDGRLEDETLDLAGPEALTVREMAARATAVLGRPVEAAELSRDTWTTGPGASLTAQARDDLLAMFRSYDRDGLVGGVGTLRDLLGREPRTWTDVLADAATA
ncbi:NmrA/HSCARG family protein [Knoellia locipacati]|uniref:Epimerase n=1 Tax=Knoellia locipacati TaxID=882824 RepID=A0A512SWX0_9MICO|nr:NmrA family NAD(P)-binding protein [Knoellia locipacati]GEQ12437.1 epimerase [Knoellia locipacati]